MNTRPPRTQNWLPYLGLITLAGGIVYQSGVVSNRVDQLTDRVSKVEAAQASNRDLLDSINLRGTRNETKLDILVDRQPAKGERR